VRVRTLLLVLTLIGVVSLISGGAILLFLHASQASTLTLTLLTLSSALFLTSIFTFVGLRLRRTYVTKMNHTLLFGISLREASFLSVVLLTYLWLAHFDALKLWVVPVGILAVGALEFFFLTHQSQGS